MNDRREISGQEHSLDRFSKSFIRHLKWFRACILRKLIPPQFSRIENNAEHLDGTFGSLFAIIRSSKQPEALETRERGIPMTVLNQVSVCRIARRGKQEEVTLRWNKLPNNYSNETRSSLVAVKMWLAGVSRGEPHKGTSRKTRIKLQVRTIVWERQRDLNPRPSGRIWNLSSPLLPLPRFADLLQCGSCKSAPVARRIVKANGNNARSQPVPNHPIANSPRCSRVRTVRFESRLHDFLTPAVQSSLALASASLIIAYHIRNGEKLSRRSRTLFW